MSAEPLDERFQAPLLGVPVVYRSNSAAVIAAAVHALRPWGELDAALIEGGPPACVEIVVQPRGIGEPATQHGAPFVVRSYGDTLIAASGASLMTANLEHGAALAVITPELAADEPRLRHEVIERLGLLLASARDRTPVEAAAVVRAGRALILAGPREAGVAALCYACLRAGFALLAADMVYVSLARGMRIWGHAGVLHLPPETARAFPDLAALRPVTGPSGTPELAVEVADLSGARVITHAERATVCFVERGSGQASHVEAVPAGEAVQRIVADHLADAGTLRDPGSGVAVALAAGGAHRLIVGADPASAAALLSLLAG